MKFSATLSLLTLAGCSLARSPAHVGKVLPERRPNIARSASHKAVDRRASTVLSGSSTIIPQNENTAKFAINGSAIPDVDFDIGEAYGGLLPISNAANASELYFFFQPTTNVNASDEILIWLNGGPGCSSLEGLLQENGPFLWQYGTFAPVENQYKWSNLTNVVWVEQPVGTGFSQGTPTAQNETDVAEQFLGFWKNFVDTFGLQDRKVYIAGESYAGQYVPYIADAMLNKNDKCYYNLDSILIYDPSITYGMVQEDLVAAAYVNANTNAFLLNDTFMADINNRSAHCGYDDFMNTWLSDSAFPPSGKLPTPPNVDNNQTECNIWNDIFNAVSLINPSFDIYQIFTTPPNLWDVLGFPGSFDYLPTGAEIYFNRTDVQKAINAPIQSWTECADGILRHDDSPPSGLSVLPGVIERASRVVIGHGHLDFILIANGTLIAIQNMTWNGAQGFSTPPSKFDDFYVPYHSELNLGNTAGAGVLGNYHTERGLTYVSVDLSGHMIPQYAPSAAYRQLEFLLGRIESLGEKGDFTTQQGDFGN
ncbi:carboxypeptidase D [Myriangium duriaei CBS 260.36]|uniref:Carboxypeptidase n=1 Tax=Myriangium duriaei CBS 260.36 TaxID=1168546 RepID=A0A9P4J9T2_9PEZI|nr:carboxypeptidase D [Myriangium duriaei CBS 260.36]